MIPAVTASTDDASIKQQKRSKMKKISLFCFSLSGIFLRRVELHRYRAPTRSATGAARALQHQHKTATRAHAVPLKVVVT
jgi:hypothetical protein